MRKSFMKKLFATLAVATLATVGAGVALTDSVVDDTNEVSAATSFATDWTITNPSAITENNGTITVVTGEDLAVYDGAAIVSNATYTNFQLEYDIKVNTTGGWAPIAMFGMHKDSTMYYHSYKFVNVNIWDAIAAIQNGQTDTTLANGGDSGQGAFSPWGSTGETVKVVTSGEKVSIKLVVQSGTVTLTMTQGNNVFTRELWSGDDLDTSLLTGRVGIPATISSNFTIEKLSITDLDKAQAVPTPPATTVNGTLLNNCEGVEGYWFGTNGTRESSTDVKTQGMGSYKLMLNAWSYMTPLLTINGASLTEEQLFEYDGIYLEIYNPGEPVNLRLYNTVAATLQTGWNQVSISKATIQEQLTLSKTDRQNSSKPEGIPLQFEQGQFFLAVDSACVLYIDNVMGINPAPDAPVGSLDGWTITNTSAITYSNGTLSFETNSGSDDGAVVISNNSYSNFQLEYDITTAAGSWVPVALIGATSSNMYYHNKFLYINDWGALMEMNYTTDDYTQGGKQKEDLNLFGVSPFSSRVHTGETLHVKLVLNRGEVHLTITKGNNLFTKSLFTGVEATGKVGIPATINSAFTINNLTITDLGEGYARKTNYTQFNSEALDANYWTGSNATFPKGEGQLYFENGGYIVSTNTYEDFVLEYDMTVSNKEGTWVPIASFGINNSTYAVDQQKSIVINQWGGVYSYKLADPAEIPGFMDDEEDEGKGYFKIEDKSVPLIHVRLVVKDGTVTLSLTQNSKTYTNVVATGVDTLGKVAIISQYGTNTVVIDNLVLIDSEEYEDYTLTKMEFSSATGDQANANQWLEGNLLEELKAKYPAMDFTTKEISFQTQTQGFFLEYGGAWSFYTDRYNNTYYLKYIITVNDLVLDGWVYPVGDASKYTIEGVMTIIVQGGEETGGNVGGGEGDTSERPVVVGESSIENIQGKLQDISFVIDTKGYEIIFVEYGSDNVKNAAYTITSGEENNVTFTFKGDFIAQLGVGEHVFSIATKKGPVSVKIVVLKATPPTIDEGKDTVVMYEKSETDAIFEINTYNLAIISVYRTGAEYQLNADAYTFINNVLTIKKEYLETLGAENYTFTVRTDGGNVEVRVIIEEVFPPIVTDEESKTFIIGGSDVQFEMDTSGAPIIQVVRTGAEKALGENAYYFNIENDTTYLTFKDEYLNTLSVGEHKFTISTAAGDAVVTIAVSLGEAPTCTDNRKSAIFGQNEAIYFDINTNGLMILAIQRTGATNGLNQNAYVYAYENGTLTIIGEYVSLLKMGEHEFTLETLAGTVKFYIIVEEAGENPGNPDIPENPEEPDVPGDGVEGDDLEIEEDNPFEEDITKPDEGEEPEQPDAPEQPDEDDNGSGSYEDVFNGSVKPSEDAYNKYLEGLENGGKVSGGCNGSLSMVAGLPVVGIIAWLIRKKKED